MLKWIIRYLARTKDHEITYRKSHNQISPLNIAKNIIKIEVCHDTKQTANILTKLLSRSKHKQHIGELGLVPV